MAKKVVRVKTKTKVVEKKGSGAVKPVLKSSAPGMLTEKIVIAVKNKK